MCKLLVGEPAWLSELLEQFNSRNIELFEHAELLADLGQLHIVEKSYRHKLEAKRSGEEGHADRATALALAVLRAKSVRSGRSSTVAGELVCWP